MLVLATGISAGAAPEFEIEATEAEIDEAQERLMEIRMAESDALADYNIALSQMNELNVKIDDANDDLDVAEKQLREARNNLQERASQVYKSGNVAFVNVLVGTDNFSEFASRLDLWVRLLEQERAAFEDVLEAKNDLEARKSALETERVRRVEAVDEALAHKKHAAEAEAEAEAYLNSLNTELRGAIQADQERRARLAREAAEQAVAERAAAEQDPPEQDPPEQAAGQEAPEPAADIQPQPDPEAQQHAAAADRRAQLAAERAAAAERQAAQRRDDRQAQREEAAEEQAAIERAAAQQAAAEQKAAERAAERRAERQAAREAAAEQAAAERAAERQAKRQAARDAAAEQAAAERRAEERQAELAAQRAAERRAAERRAEERRAEEASASASATASPSASASAEPRGGGGPSSCGDDFGGVAPYVAEAGCDLKGRFGLRITGVGLSGYHWDGMDLDVWTSSVTLGNQVRDYTVANYDVEYTCWQDHYVNYLTGWEETCPGHMDHVHITFSHR
jgi:peptidoglycan DL-endopeptidase RipA